MNTRLPAPGAVRPFPTPEPDEVRQRLLTWCGADPADADAAAAAVEQLVGTDLLIEADRRYQAIAADMGGRMWLSWPKPPPETGPAERLLGLYPVLAAIDLMTEFHRGIGVDQDRSRALLQDVGEKLRLNRRLYGRPGLDVAFWFTAHVRGTIYEIGRLQFCLEGSTERPRLGMHIRGEGGPLTPAAVRDSVSRALDFFPSAFGHLFGPDRPMEFVCNSWLLDPQLRDWLPEHSNILAFGSMFDLVGPDDYGNADGHDDIRRFVFASTPDTPDDRLPAENTLQRSILAGIEQGVGFRTRLGGLNLERLGL